MELIAGVIFLQYRPNSCKKQFNPVCPNWLQIKKILGKPNFSHHLMAGIQNVHLTNEIQSWSHKSFLDTML